MLDLPGLHDSDLFQKLKEKTDRLIDQVFLENIETLCFEFPFLRKYFILTDGLC
jgi:hypothetical protein